MAICSGRRGIKPYDEYEENAEENSWTCLWMSTEDIQPANFCPDTFRKYDSEDSYSSHMGRKCPVSSRKTYSSGSAKCFGGASNFPRKNFSRRRI